jgi:tetratricopeptide (TPR) repeat protein
MARKQRYRPETERIEIERNVIERYLMLAKSYIKNNRKMVINSFLGLIILIVISVTLILVVDWVITRDQKRFDEIMNNYAKYTMTGEKENMQLVIRDLQSFVDSSYFGFPHAMGYYVLGNIYYDRKDYKNSDKYLRLYADKESSSILSSLALLKAAIACEELNDLKGALGIYKRLETDYAGSVIADQIYFNYARLFGKMNDIYNSRMYYDKVITLFPDSQFANLARKRLFMIQAR